MKTYGILCFVLTIAILVCPICALDYSSFSFENIKDTVSIPKPSVNLPIQPSLGQDTVSVQAASGNVIEASELEYIVGCVAAEISPEYEEEAIKAQAVAAYTNLKRLKKHPDTRLENADISADPAIHQGYIDKVEREKKWGSKATEYEDKITALVSEILGQTITYENEPIVAAYYAIASGRSESAAVIWGEDIPYLQSVVSIGDRLSPDCIKTTEISPDAFREAVAKDSEIVLSENIKEWVQDITYSENHSGVVTSVTVGGKVMRGVDLRTLLNLRSPAFEYYVKDNMLCFKTAGYGHLVGLSQNGANYMAKQGSTYDEILLHYYPGCKIQ